jgi:hypothetical protein
MKAFNYGSLRKSLSLFVGLCAMGLQAGAARAQRWDHKDSLRADLNPLSQVPSVLAGSHGNFEAEVHEDGSITFQLSYAGMSSSVVQNQWRRRCISVRRRSQAGVSSLGHRDGHDHCRGRKCFAS